MNFFAARFYDPVLARWHSPDPLEQFHSPYLAMCDDPVQQFLTAAQRRLRNANPDAIGTNFTDPDGRAGIPFLQDFMKSTLGECVIGSIGAIGGAFGIAGLMSIGGAIGNVVSGAISIGTTANSIKSVASLANQGSGVARGGNTNKTQIVLADIFNQSPSGNSSVSTKSKNSLSPTIFTMHLLEVKSPKDDEYILWKASFSVEYSDGSIEALILNSEDQIYFGQMRKLYNIPGNKKSDKVKHKLKWESGDLMTKLYSMEWNENVIRIVGTTQYFHPATQLGQSRGCFLSCEYPVIEWLKVYDEESAAMWTSSGRENDKVSKQNLRKIRDLYNNVANGNPNVLFQLQMNSFAQSNTQGLFNQLWRAFNSDLLETTFEIIQPK